MNFLPVEARMPQSIDPGSFANARSVERAVGELRRGRPVLVAGSDGCLAALAAETATPVTLAWLRGVAPGAALVITAHRGAVLHINPSGEEVEILALAADQDVADVQAIADPTADLGSPLKGPFRRGRSDESVLDVHRAAVRLTKIARLLPAVVVSAPMDIATAGRLAAAHDLLSVQAADIDAYEDNIASALQAVATAHVPLAGADKTRLIAFRPADGGVEHLAILIGEPKPHEAVLTRLHSECFTGDLLASLKCDCGDQLRGAIGEIAQAGGGIILYIAQEGRGIGLINKLRAYSLQDQGFDTVDANERLGFLADERAFRPAAEMLKRLGFGRVRLMTNNPDKVAALAELGIEVCERVPHAFPSNLHNEHYLLTKRKRSGHYL